MTTRNENIIEAAIRVFMRYGIRKATMNDIAKEAGLVRQTLYTAYSNKDDILCAAIRYYSEGSLAVIQREWANAESLSQRLDIYFEYTAIASLAIIRASPDAADMIDGYNDAGRAEIRQQHAIKNKAISVILEPYLASIAKRGLELEQYADFIQSAAMGLRNLAHEEAHLRSMLAALKASILSVAETK